MKNIVVERLDYIFEGVSTLKKKYSDLYQNHLQLKEQLRNLKVETEKQQTEINKLLKEREGRKVVNQKSVMSHSQISSDEKLETLKKEHSEKNAQIKLQLDGFIEDIDQCIQVIQAKE